MLLKEILVLFPRATAAAADDGDDDDDNMSIDNCLQSSCMCKSTLFPSISSYSHPSSIARPSSHIGWSPSTSEYVRTSREEENRTFLRGCCKDAADGDNPEDDWGCDRLLMLLILSVEEDADRVDDDDEVEADESEQIDESLCIEQLLLL